MDELLHDANGLWTADLTVGSTALDQANCAMFSVLASAESRVAAATGPELAAWLSAVVDRFDGLLRAEEAELATIGYPELAFHRQLHDHARGCIQAARNRLARQPHAVMLEQLTRDTCTELAVWLLRHVQDADQLFFPYIDARFRRCGS